jgi:hypothetical protein
MPYFATVTYLQSSHTEAVPMSVGARASWSLPETFLSEGQAVRLGSLGRGDRALRAHLLHGCEYGSLTLIDPVALVPW